MTEQDPPRDGGAVLTLQQLIQTRRRERGWSYRELARRTDHQLTYGRWQQLGSNVRMKAFPDVENIPLIAGALEVSQTIVVLAIAKSLGLDVSYRASDLAQQMPAGTDQLSPDVRDAILAVIRATVAEALARQGDAASRSTVQSGPSVLDWRMTEPAAETKRNAQAKPTD